MGICYKLLNLDFPHYYDLDKGSWFCVFNDKESFIFENYVDFVALVQHLKNKNFSAKESTNIANEIKLWCGSSRLLLVDETMEHYIGANALSNSAVEWYKEKIGLQFNPLDYQETASILQFQE